MLLSANHLIDFDVEAIDGNIGNVKDIYFDDTEWVIRYIVVDTGKFLPGKRVLLSPKSFGHPQAMHKIMPVDLTCEKVKSSPDASTELPVSKLEEIELHKYYNWIPYWDNDFLTYPSPILTPPPIDKGEMKEFEEKVENTSLRSLGEVIGYHIKAKDGKIGHIEDFIIEESDWSVKYMIVDTRNFLSGRKVLLALDWVGDFDWAGGTVEVDMTVEAIKKSPEFNPEAPINREYEIQLFDYYGRPKYWR
ncbi:MAG: PRC-barrel domain-containing protein [Sedimentisphaeraceae bacterium JB056]